MCLLLAVVRVTGSRLDGERLPDGAAKGHILKAIGKATRIIALSSALKVIGLSKSRYHTWKRADKACELTDRSSCPKKSPNQLTPAEIESIRQMATSVEYRHMPTSTLSRFASTSGEGLCLCVNLAKVDSGKRLAAATCAHPSSQANFGYSSDEVE
jgi:hypothetical protein